VTIYLVWVCPQYNDAQIDSVWLDKDKARARATWHDAEHDSGHGVDHAYYPAEVEEWEVSE
jgi:hypothetical protein